MKTEILYECQLGHEFTVRRQKRADRLPDWQTPNEELPGTRESLGRC